MFGVLNQKKLRVGWVVSGLLTQTKLGVFRWVPVYIPTCKRNLGSGGWCVVYLPKRSLGSGGSFTSVRYSQWTRLAFNALVHGYAVKRHQQSLQETRKDNDSLCLPLTWRSVLANCCSPVITGSALHICHLLTSGNQQKLFSEVGKEVMISFIAYSSYRPHGTDQYDDHNTVVGLVRRLISSNSRRSQNIFPWPRLVTFPLQPCTWASQFARGSW